MEKVAEIEQQVRGVATVRLPVSVIIPARNEAHNLSRCLQALQNVGEVRAPLQALEEAAALADAATVLDHPWQPGHDAFVEAGNAVGGSVIPWTEVDPGFNHREICPDIGAAQCVNFEEFHRIRLAG